MGLIYLIYAFLGIILGITEVLPISNAGHFRLFNYLFNIELLFDYNLLVLANFGSFLAILVFFRKEVKILSQAFFRYIKYKKERKKLAPKFKYCLLIIIGSFPLIITNLLFKNMKGKYLAPQVLGIAFLITALSLFICQDKKGEKEDKDITYKKALLIGLLQILSLCPGVSRSGIVLMGCLLLGLKKDSALKYTFLLALPVGLENLLLKISDLLKVTYYNDLIFSYALTIFFAGGATYFSYCWLDNILKNGKLKNLAFYCLALALFLFLYFR